MNLFEKILYFLQKEIPEPTPFGWYHLLCIGIMLLFIVILFIRRKKHNDKQLKIVLATYGIIVLVLEILKQLTWSFNYDPVTQLITWDYEWYAFPFQLCTTPVYISLICLFIITALLINYYVILYTKKKIISLDDVKEQNRFDCILILGAGVKNNEPSKLLKDRLDKTIEIYNQNRNIKIIVSGDSQNPSNYDEITVMRNYLINNGVDKDNIFEDKYGISTYDSIYRIKDIVKNKKIIVITQKYHLYRSVYIAREFDLVAVGVSSKEYKYPGQLYRDIREILARIKDYMLVKLKIDSKY